MTRSTHISENHQPTLLRHLGVFFTEYKSIDIWLRYKDFSDFPNSKIIAGMLGNLAVHH